MNTKGMGIALLSAAALLGSSMAQADMSWTYGEIGYAKGDGVDVSGFGNSESDAFDLKASIGFADMFHASVGYTDGNLEGGLASIGTTDSDFDGYRLVFGVNPQLTPNTQVIGDIAYYDYDLDGTVDGGEGSFAYDGGLDGFALGFGLRHSVTSNFEIMGEVWYSDGSIDDVDADYNNTSAEFSARYNWTPSLSTGLTFGYNGGFGTGLETGDTLRLDVRWSFLGGLSK